MASYQLLKETLMQSIKRAPESSAVYFKTGPGQYAEHDQFIGVPVPTLRKIAKEFDALPFEDLQLLLESPINEERLIALILLVDRYKRAKTTEKESIYQFYLNNLQYVNNWNLVDSSAHLIIGMHLLKGDKQILLKLTQSQVMWERRVAIVATWYFIRNNEFDWTMKLAEILLEDPHDLIHKAVGWMLREVGERDVTVLVQFLDKHAHKMPRTMLRYSIEKFPQDQRKAYLLKKM